MLRLLQPFTLDSLLPHLWISGRSSRAEWWRVHIICAVVATVFDHMFIARLEQGLGGMSDAPVTILWLAITAILGWISFASVARRLHDRGKSGWWALLYLVPGIGWLGLIIECGFLPSRALAAAPAPVPVFMPKAAPQRQRPASRAPLSATPRVGTIQRVEHRPWTPERAIKLASSAVGLILAGFVLYEWFLDTSSLSVFELHPVEPHVAE